MNLINGKYLDYEICAFSGSRNSMWLIVFDGKYNYMLFNTTNKRVLELYERNGLPSNHSHGVYCIEYYSTLNNALDNLARVLVNGNCFNPMLLKNVFGKGGL